MKLSKIVFILVLGWVAVVAAGVYYTYFRQPEEMELLKQAEEVARMKNTELLSLQTEQVALTEVTNETLRKWHARYKIIPEELTTAEVIGRLNELTKDGFKNFDLTFGGESHSPDFKFYTFSITGRGYFSNLYRLIWEIENGRDMYRIRDLSLDHIDLTTEDQKTGRPRLEVMVSFNLRLEAYFDGIEGASAPSDVLMKLAQENGVPLDRMGDLPPVPRELLPARSAAANPFFPMIMQQLPPNTHGLIDVEKATLVSIVGQKAVFQEGDIFRTAGPGDSVYLGRIAVVDPMQGRVVVRLNKGGIFDEVEMKLPTVDRLSAAPIKN